MIISRGLNTTWYMHIVEYNVAIKNNIHLYVIIQKDYIAIFPGKKHRNM